MKNTISNLSRADLYPVLKQACNRIVELFKNDTEEPDLPTLRMRFMIDDFADEKLELKE